MATEIVQAPVSADHPVVVDDRSEADRAAFAAASFVRRPQPTPDLPPLPRDPAARRRILAVRGW